MITTSVTIKRAKVILAEIAVAWYGDERLDAFLYETNKTILLAAGMKDGTMFLPVGIMIEVPVDYPLFPRTVQGTETIGSGEDINAFASRVLGSKIFSDAIYDANQINRADGFAFKAGEALVVPAIADAEKIDDANRRAAEAGGYWRE